MAPKGHPTGGHTLAVILLFAISMGLISIATYQMIQIINIKDRLEMLQERCNCDVTVEQVRPGSL